MKIVLEGGRTIAMESLEQQLVYGGVLCGRFTKAENARRVRDYAEEAGRRASWFDEACIIPAQGSVVPARPEKALPEGERLPPVISFAVFRSDTPANDAGECYSSAAFAWCQHDFGLPDERTLAILRAIDWPALAVDWTP